MANIHLDASESGLKLPLGPIMSPKPGPTFEMAVMAPDSAVIKSSPVKASAIASRTKHKIYNDTKLITDADVSSEMGLPA